MASCSDQVSRQSLQQDPNDSCGYFTMFVHNYGGRRKNKSLNVRVQADLDETRATMMFVQEAGEEFRRDDATWHVSHDKETGLATAARKLSVESFTNKRAISHLDGINKQSECFTGVQVTSVVLKKETTLSHKTVIFIHCHFHYCTAKRQKGGGFRESFTWFFTYVTSCFNDFAKLNDGSASLPCS